MPLMELNDEQTVAGLAVLEPELATLLEDKGVRRELRAVTGHLGLGKMSVFANIESDAAEFKKLIMKEFGFTADDNLQEKIALSVYVEAWKACQERKATEQRLANEARAAGTHRELTVLEANGLRDAHARVHGELEDHEFPGRDYLAWRLGQFETGDFRAETLVEVVSYERAQDGASNNNLSLEWNCAGKVTAVRKRVEQPRPRTPEQLRKTYDLIRVQWQVVCLKYPDRHLCVRFDEGIWDRLLRYLLGPKVWEYRTRASVGIQWEDLLEYEYQIRKLAFKKVSRKQLRLSEALEEAMDDVRLHQQYFTLQICTSGARQPRQDQAEPENKGSMEGKGNKRLQNQLSSELAQVKKLRAELARELNDVKHHSKGNTSSASGSGATGSGKGNKGDGKSVSPEMRRYREMAKRENFRIKLDGSGKMICTWFQTGNCRNGEQCRFEHVCMRCHKPGHTCMDPQCSMAQGRA